MLGYVLFLVFLTYLLCCIVYIAYKLVWYVLSLLRLKIKLGKLSAKGATVSFNRKFRNIVFGKKGLPNFTVTTPTDVYRVTVLSSLSTHGRWNIEKQKEHFYLDVRLKSKIFYKNEYHSNRPAHVNEFRGEMRFYRKPIFLETKNTTDEKAILLLFPKPKTATFSETKMDYLYSGSQLCDYEVMFERDFFELFSNLET